jgi:hypothetical protein
VRAHVGIAACHKQGADAANPGRDRRALRAEGTDTAEAYTRALRSHVGRRACRVRRAQRDHERSTRAEIERREEQSTSDLDEQSTDLDERPTDDQSPAKTEVDLKFFENL